MENSNKREEGRLDNKGTARNSYIGAMEGKGGVSLDSGDSGLPGQWRFWSAWTVEILMMPSF